MTVLTSSRLRLRKLTIMDADFIVELLNDPNWLKYIGDRDVKNVQDALVYIQQEPQAMYQQYTMGLLLVESLEHQKPVGLCGLLKRIELSHPDLGFAFLPQYRKQGFALEAAERVLADVCERKLTEKVLAITSIDNENSINLLKKLNFSFTGLIRLGDSVDETNLFELTVKT
jgi:ribosomal-protein-alanine N-acetyltransferase